MTFRIHYTQKGELKTKDIKADCFHDAQLCLPVDAEIQSVWEVLENGSVIRY